MLAGSSLACRVDDSRQLSGSSQTRLGNGAPWLVVDRREMKHVPALRLLVEVEIELQRPDALVLELLGKRSKGVWPLRRDVVFRFDVIAVVSAERLELVQMLEGLSRVVYDSPEPSIRDQQKTP